MRFASLYPVLFVITGKCTLRLNASAVPCVVVAAYRSGKLENLATCRVVCMCVLYE